MSLFKLPYEILSSITDLCRSRDILSLALTCHEATSLIVPALYRVNIKFEASSALIWAAHHNKASLAKRILDLHWKDINIINGQSPLVIAAHAGSLSVLEAILQRADVNINLRLHSGTALWWAARNGHTAIVERLLRCKNIRANDPGESNRTPLAVSIAWGAEDTSMVLLRSGLASINATDDYGMTPLLLALRHRKERLAQELLCYSTIDGTCRDFKGRTPLFYATHRGITPVIKRLLVIAKFSINTPNIRNQTPLFFAVRHGSLSTAKILLEAGANPNVSDTHGVTPLMEAVTIGWDMVNLVLSYGAEVNAMNNLRETPLHMATDLGSEAVVRLLLGHKAMFNTHDLDGRTPLWLAIRNGHVAVARELLALEYIDVNMTFRSTSPLHEAVKSCQLPVIRMLCARKELNPNSLDRRGLTPLGIAAELGKPEIVEILLNTKSIQVDAGSVTPLWTAAKEGNPNIICQLIRAGADLSFCSKGKSILAMAMRARNPRLLDFLLR